MRIFLSYHTPDAQKAEALKAAIEAKECGAEVFVATQNLRCGANWQPQLAKTIAEADAFLILIGQTIGRWQLPEYYVAHDRLVMEPSFALIPVLIAERAPSLPFLSTIHWLQTSDPAGEPSLSKIIAALKGKAAGAPGELWRSVNPYRGLESLKEQDADLFFGREAETKAVLGLLAQARTAENRIATLVGNSGVGKSSIVEAGVFAGLRRQRMPDGSPWPAALSGSREWAYTTMRPGEDPFAALVSAFMSLWFGDDVTNPDLYDRRSKWIERLKDGGGSIRDLLDATQARFESELGLFAPRRIVLNINQSEELYSLTPEALRGPFSNLIARGLDDPRLCAVASLRSDYYGYLQANGPLFKRSVRLDVLPFDVDGLKTAFAEPARVLGARFEPENLADFIVSSTAGQAGALPLLAFYMTDLWRRMQARGDGVLRLAEKSEIIDVSRVLTAEADRFLAEHPADLDAIKRLFTLKLALVQEEGKPVRRRVSRNRLNENEARLVDALADARLVTTGEDAGGAFAEVAHEVLLQSWRTLASWLDAERGFLIFKGRCERARVRWDGEKRDPRALLSGLDLIQAEQWLATRARDFDPEDADFILASIAARNAELAAAARLRRRVQGITVFAAVAMAFLALIAGWKWFDADRGWREAEQREAENTTLSGDFLRALAPQGSLGEFLGKYILAGRQIDPAAGLRSSLERAAANGNHRAMFYLGALYTIALGVPRDYVKAREWYEKAAAKDDDFAMTSLGALYATGKGVPRDFDKAREWLEKAAAKEDPPAMASLGALYVNGQGVPRDFDKAREWYEKAAAKDDAFAMASLGRLYVNGQGVPRDYVKAREWLEKAAAKDDAFAMVKLGGLYANGQGVAQDYGKAREWLEKAAAKDDAFAMTGLGSLYANGQGVPQDYAKAREWLEKAAGKEDPAAMTGLGSLYANGQGVPRDYVNSREWYEKAAEKDDAEAMSNLGLLYQNGQGVPQDSAKAREWYEKAAAAGSEDAKGELRRIPVLVLEAYAAKDYAKATRLQAEFAQAIEKDEVAEIGKAGPRTASALNSLSRYQLFDRQFETALASSNRAMELQPNAYVINYTHALMFLGRESEARALHLKYKGQLTVEGSGLWEDVILKDFSELEKAGLQHSLMDDIRKEFALTPEKN
jgi:TPR repeat protein